MATHKLKILSVIIIGCCSLMAFIFDEAQTHYVKGLEHLESHKYINAIGDFTSAISLKRDFADAYYQRAKSKYLLGKQAGFFSTDLCYDLISAIKYGNDNALDMLLEKSTTQCYTVKSMNVDPDVVFCADFSSQVLSDIPVNAQKFDFLAHLNLFDNKFKSIPNAVFNYQYLVHLDISSNQIQTLPADIAKLAYVRELNLNKNEIKSLSPEIYNLKKLRRLFLRQNALTSIPETISKLGALKELDLSLNQLTTLPANLSKMKHLEELILVGNPLPESIVKELKKALPDTQIYF